MKTFHVNPGSDLDRLLGEVSTGTVVVERDGTRYRLTVERDGDPWFDYRPDADAVRAALAETVGSWADLDAEAMIADIYRWREEGSRPADRP